VTSLVDWVKGVLRLGNPQVIVGVGLVAVALLVLKPRWGRRFVAAATLGYWFLSTPFGSTLTMAPLARGFHPIESPGEAGSAAAIVLLGGGIEETRVESDLLAVLTESTALRTLEAARLFKLLEGRPFVVASGGVPRGLRTPESDVMAEALVRLGVPRERILVENESRTTHEQAILVTRMLKARGIDRFVLVTWPTHLWRSVASFRAQHADVVPSAARLAADQGGAPAFFLPNSQSLRLSDEAIWEYAAGAYYWSRGWFRPVPASR